MGTNQGGAILDEMVKHQSNIYTSIPAKVVTYDSNSQLCSVEFVVRRPYSSGVSPETIRAKDVPVGFYYGSDWVIAATLKKGDAVILIFPMFDIENWLTGDKGKIYDASGYQFHNMDGAFALPIAFTHNSPTRDSRFKDKFHIVSKSNYITMGEEGVNIAAGGTTIELSKDGDIEMTAPLVKVNGNMQITGTLNSGGAMTAPSANIGGKEMSEHNHNYTDDGVSKVTGVNNG